MKMMEKKKDSQEMTPEEKKAKMDVIMELLEIAHEAMGSNVKSGLDGMTQKVEVMAPNKEKLIEGLEKAEEVVEEGPEALMSSEQTEETEEKSEEVEEETEEVEEDEEDKKKLKKKPLFNMFD